MPSAYVDRGIMKWAPYDALVGYQPMLSEMRYRLGKKDKPVLSDDALEELNRQLQEAIMTKQEIELRYYHDGYVRFTFGTVKRIDYVKKQVILSTWEKFLAEDIIEIRFQ